MSSRSVALIDPRLKTAWADQRARVDAWELKPFPVLEWTEFEAFLFATATTVSLVVGPRPNLERELVELVGSYLTNDKVAQLDPAFSNPPGRAWSALPLTALSGEFVDAMRRLHAYASIGTLLDDDLPGTADQLVRRIETDLQSLDALLKKLPKATAPADRLNLQMLHDIALARLAVDEGTHHAPAAGLAWLGKVSVKTVQNLLARGDLVVDGPASADPHSARGWLADRKRWSRSCWREAIEVIASGLAAPFQEFDSQVDSPDPTESDRDAVEWVFVPRAADGATFVPNLMRQRGWTIGPRGSERTFGDYWRALDFLQKTDRPHWRRPSESGAYNLVVAKDWVRIPRSELDLQLRATLKTGGRS